MFNYNFVKKVSIVALLCLMQSFYTAKAFYINPGYEDFVRNKRDHTTVCVQINPNGVDSPEPFYMCKGPEFPPRQLIVPVQFLQPTGESSVNFNHQQPALKEPTQEYYQNLEQPQTLQFGNAQQLMTQTPQNEGGYLDNNKPPETAEMQHYSLPSTANLEQHSHILANNPSSFASHPQNNHESMRSSSETDKMPTTETKQNDENANARVMEPSKNEPNNRQQMPTTEAVKHNITPEQFKTLLEEEVLGNPNLALTQDEMLPFQNMYRESKTEKPLISETSYIPPEYLNDPVLRTFYNIQQANTAEEQYVPKTMQQNKPILQKPPLSAGVTNNCPNLPTYSMMSDHLPQTESTGPMPSSKCGDCPLTYQPIFIAIPWPTSSYHNQMSNNQPTSCGNVQQANSELLYDNSYRSKSRANNDNSSMEDLSKKDSSIPSEVPKNSAQPPQTISTKAPESSEEDLFVDDTTAKTDDEKSNEDEQDDKKDEIISSSTRIPHTTVRTFKTMMHTAKMYAQLANNKHNPPPEAQNKRHIQHMAGGGGYPSNFKKEYLRKLETNFY